MSEEKKKSWVKRKRQACAIWRKKCWRAFVARVNRKWEKVKEWLYKYLTGIAIIGTVLIIAGNWLLKEGCTGLHNCIKELVPLKLYQILTLWAGIIGLLWTNKRYKLGEKRYEQTERNQLLSKLNTLFADAVKALSDKEEKKTPKGKNLINVIQATIYQQQEEGKETLQNSVLNFVNMDLSEANLKGANLKGAILQEADLKEAILTRAKLQGADLKGAILLGADLKGAILTKAKLTRAILKGTKLSYSKGNLKIIKESGCEGADEIIWCKWDKEKRKWYRVDKDGQWKRDEKNNKIPV